MSKSIRVLLKNVRCQFPKLFVADEFMGKRTFSVGLLLPAGDPALKVIEDAALKAAEAQYPGKGEAMLRRFRQSKTTWPVRSLDDGGFLITPKRKEEQGAPMVFNQRKQLIPADAGLPYAGCWLNVSADIFCYTKSGGGITCYLNGVQLVREDAPLGGGATAASCKDDFEDISGESLETEDTSDLI